MSNAPKPEVYAELQLAPDVEIDFMLALAIGYQAGKDILKIRGPGQHVEVFHDVSWRVFSHKDAGVMWPIAIKYSLLPVPVSSWEGLESDVPPTSGPSTKYKVSKSGSTTVSTPGSVTLQGASYYSHARRVAVMADTPEKALAFAVILKNRFLAI